MKTVTIEDLLEFIDDQLLLDKLHYFLRKRKDFTHEEADKAFKELGLDEEDNEVVEQLPPEEEKKFLKALHAAKRIGMKEGAEFWMPEQQYKDLLSAAQTK